MKIKFNSDPVSHLIFWPAYAAGLLLDLWSKSTVFENLSDYEGRDIINGFLRIIAAQNDGAAFGIAAGRTKFLTAVSLTAIVVVFIIFLFGSRKSKLFYLALGLLTAGISGNLYDRLFNNGLVRDFIDVYIGSYHWPAFNVADSLLCISVGLIILLSFTGTLYRKPSPQQK